MKIISKYKDFYDYMVGIYGHDPLVVYDRRSGVVSKPNYEGKESYGYGNTIEPDVHAFYICGVKYKLHYYKNNVYHTKNELLKLHELLLKDGNESIFDNYKWQGIEKSVKEYYNKHNGETKINVKLEQPVLILERGGYWNGLDDLSGSYQLVNLAPYKLAKYIPADKMFQDVYSFLSKLKDKDILNKQSDIEKVVSHGFDKKISFRHRK